MKQSSAVLLFVIYLFTQAAAPCWYITQQLSHHFFAVLQQFEQSGDRLVTVSMDTSALSKLQTEEGEIMLDGILYDIENTVTSGSNKILYLKKDWKETQWQRHTASLNKLLHKQTHPKNWGHLRIRGMFIAFFYERTAFKEAAFYLKKEKKYVVYFINKYTPPYPGLSSPPPKNGSFTNG